MMKDHSEVQPTADLLAMFGQDEVPATESPDASRAVRALEIGNRVRAARTRAGIKAVELARLVGLDRDKLSKVEHGRRRITPLEMPRFATALGVTTQYLLEGVRGDTPALAFRVAHPDAPVSQARRRASAILDAEARLARLGVLAPATSTPEGAGVLAAAAEVAARQPRTSSEAQRQGRDLAYETRRLLDLGSGEIGDLAGLAEQHFAADVAFSPVGEDVSGLCAHAPGQALLLANSECTTGHVRFTLGHELAHHLLGDPRDVIEESTRDLYSSNYIERRASAFAAYLLLPERGVRSTLSWLGATSEDLHNSTAEGRAALGYVMAKHGVSMPCALYQFAAFNLLSFDRADALEGGLRASGVLQAAAYLLPAGGNVAVATGEVRVPTRLLSSAWLAARAGKIGLGTLSRLLDRDDDDELFDDVFGNTADDGGAEGNAADAR
jgi:transcriptional regulator with XRE-family HTH domain